MADASFLQPDAAAAKAAAAAAKAKANKKDRLSGARGHSTVIPSTPESHVDDSDAVGTPVPHAPPLPPPHAEVCIAFPLHYVRTRVSA